MFSIAMYNNLLNYISLQVLNAVQCNEALADSAIQFVKGGTIVKGNMFTLKNSVIYLSGCQLDPYQTNSFSIQLLDDKTAGLEIGLT